MSSAAESKDPKRFGSIKMSIRRSMVLPGEEDYMATKHERSKILHNFTFPDLKWGSQRNLRCMKVDSDGGLGDGYQRIRRRSSSFKFDTATPFCFGGGSDQRSNNQIRRLESKPSRSTENEGIEEFREKIMSDLRTVADKMRESIFRKQALGDEDEEEQTNDKERQIEEKTREIEVSPPEVPREAMEARPWNLRKRRSACKALISKDENQYNDKGLGIEEKRVTNPSILVDKSANSTRWRESKERLKFLSTLSKKEIEQDYMKMMGHRPPRRPKKRLRSVQKQVDLLKPAFYFSEITEGNY